MPAPTPILWQLKNPDPQSGTLIVVYIFYYYVDVSYMRMIQFI